ncbi:MAG: hypothetical protein NTX36_09505, partial [Proteobacteria bacterium]|nr:hypothetical protein [Pseudomonadota bacterium]
MLYELVFSTGFGPTPIDFKNSTLSPKEMFPSTHQLHIFDPFYWLNSLDVQGRRLPEDVHTCTSPLSGTPCFAIQWVPGRSVSH